MPCVAALGVGDALGEVDVGEQVDVCCPVEALSSFAPGVVALGGELTGV